MHKVQALLDREKRHFFCSSHLDIVFVSLNFQGNNFLVAADTSLNRNQPITSGIVVYVTFSRTPEIIIT